MNGHSVFWLRSGNLARRSRHAFEQYRDRAPHRLDRFVRWPFSEREPWARGSPLTWPTPACRWCCWIWFLRELQPARSKAAKNKFVLAALDGLKKSKPAAFFTPENARLIRIGNFDDDLALIADCDWIIEVVAEDLGDQACAARSRCSSIVVADSILTSNTSGLPIHKIVEGMSDDLRRHWFGTHFFNPPRYMRLLEIIATPDTDPADGGAGRAVLRPASGQGDRPLARYAELHREPHRDIFDEQCDPPDAGAGTDD